MLGLVNYDSDEEDENAPPIKETSKLEGKHTESKRGINGNPEAIPHATPVTSDLDFVDVVRQGPLLGPAAPTAGIDSPVDGVSSAPGSPYTQSRELVHSLTLPPLPNVSIPASPPGSPRESASAKVGRFLELKSQGVHFNAKLASSSALRNPSLLQNLMNFAGINEYDQYATTLSTGLKPIPEEGFPKWAYVEELAKSQQDVLKKKESEKLGERREFIAASGPSSGGGTPQSDGRGAIKGSAAERIMAGLDRERTRSPQFMGNRGRRDGDHRRSRFDDRSARRRSRSRSPKRRRDT